ncbi:hypothetical protein M427DRAFT_66591 [Gonapodya prolifera JEL478]|uniref:K Homology domain-containing protein n=1 Tax=Gonapodya prolifera (strain JEL478) TaxID=1344416 RepID=A0A139AV95_GONPJ|nr:hypothetical protein M427DRAFT_66591 [Gonapodya prolifera JEL478]|eukprot:KXS20652.1 hypothetical protein M427DRAFT_66591 [Gonapodya prolifera JEL478]
MDDFETSSSLTDPFAIVAPNDLDIAAGADGSAIAEVEIESTPNPPTADDFPALPSTSRVWSAPSWGTVGQSSGGPVKSAGKGGKTTGALSGIASVSDVFEIPYGLQARKASFPGEIVRKVRDTHKDVAVEVITRRNGPWTFTLRGPSKEAIALVRRELMAGLSVKTILRLPVPTSVRPFIIGAGGKNLKSITQRCLVDINVPKQARREESDAVAPSAEDEDEDMEVTITGDVDGVEIARREILEIVSVRAAKSTARLTIPRIYHPFILREAPAISAISSVAIHVPTYASRREREKEQANGTESAIPPRRRRDVKEDQDPNEVVIVGERENVRKAADVLKTLVANLQSSTAQAVLVVPRHQHRFLLGPKGSNLAEILERTGCAVEVPRVADLDDEEEDGKGEEVKIVGPKEKLHQGLAAVLEKANSQHAALVPFTQIVPDSSQRSHLVRYLLSKQRQILREIEQGNSVEINSRRSREGRTIEITGKSRPSVEIALARVSDHVRQMAETRRFATVLVAPALHAHVVGKKGAGLDRMRQKIGDRFVDAVVPVEGEQDVEEDEVVVVVDVAGVPAQQVAETIGEVVKAVQEAVGVLADYTSSTQNIDVKYHGRLIGHGGTTLRELLAATNSSVSVNFPKPAKDGELDSVPPSNAVVVKGPKDKVDEVVKKMKEMVAEWKHFEVMCGFEELVLVPSGIGKKVLQSASDEPQSRGRERDNTYAGAWVVKAIRDRVISETSQKPTPANPAITDRHIQLTKFDLVESSEPGKPDRITVTGAKKVVQAAKDVILERAQRLADSASIEVSIPRQWHGKLIGKEGKNIKKLIDKYDVTINFPVRGKDYDEDAEEDDGEPRNIVKIRGPKGGVEKAKKELLDLLDYEIAHSYSDTISVPKAAYPQIVGRGGSVITGLQTDNGVRIARKSTSPDDEDGDGEVTLIIEGTEEGVNNTKARILEIANDSVQDTRRVNIPHRQHRSIIGPGGAHIRELIEEISSEIGVSSERIKVKFPKDEGSDAVIVLGPPNHLDIIVERISSSIQQAATHMMVPRSEVPRIVGSGGETVREIASKFSVNIQIAKRGAVVEDGSESEQPDNTVRVDIRGKDEAMVEAAKAEILSKLRYTKELEVPQVLSNFLAADNVLNRKLRSYGQGPNDLSAEFQRGRVLLRGDIKLVEGAVKDVTSRVAELEAYTYSDQVFVPANVRAALIGQGGSTINKIRTESGCLVDVVNASRIGGQNDQEAVVVLGESEESVQNAKDRVETIVKDRSSSSPARSAKSDSGDQQRRTVTRTVNIPQRFHGRIIGPKGRGLDEVRAQCGGIVNVQFPPPMSGISDVLVKGAPAEVDRCIQLLEQAVRSMDGEVRVGTARPPSVASAMRIDDTASQADSDDQSRPRHPPGYSGRAEKFNSGRKSKTATSSVNGVSGGYTEAVAEAGPVALSSETRTDEWVVIEKKGSKKSDVPANAPSASASAENATSAGPQTAPSETSGSSNKKKKNKKSKSETAPKDIPFAEPSSSHDVGSTAAPAPVLRAPSPAPPAVVLAAPPQEEQPKKDDDEGWNSVKAHKAKQRAAQVQGELSKEGKAVEATQPEIKAPQANGVTTSAGTKKKASKPPKV